MRKALPLLFILCFQFGFGQNNIDVLHYSFNIILNDKDDTIKASAMIKFIAKQTLNFIELDFADLNSDKKGMIVNDVQFAPFSTPLFPFEHKNGKLKIDLTKQLKKGDTSWVTIRYQGIPSDGLIISKTKYGRRSFFADNWPNRGHNWIPCHDDPADKATVDFFITAPEHYQVVANGIQIEETSYKDGSKLTYWKEETPISTKVMVIGVADFAVNLSGTVNGCIPVYSWVYPENRNNGFIDYAQAKEILEYYIGHVGPYGYKKLANVQSKTRFGGLENANTIFYAENSVTGTKKNEGLLAHEIAHQWFGNMATEKSFGHLWLSEGFATYCTILYFENKLGKDEAKKLLVEDREQILQFSKRNDKAVVNTEETNYMKLLNPNSYQKGGWVLHMLRSELGDSVFWRSIRKYYATYAGSVADTRDLQKVFEEVSGKELKQFFDQWLYTSGQPQLDIKWKYTSQSKEVVINVQQTQPGNFIFPLELALKNSSGKLMIEKIYLDGKSKTLTVKSDGKPVLLIPDPSVKLLAGFTVKEN